jgi:hypothetical protein
VGVVRGCGVVRAKGSEIVEGWDDTQGPQQVSIDPSSASH